MDLTVLEYLDAIYSYIINNGIAAILIALFGASAKIIGTTIYNIFASKKIAQDIQRSFTVKRIIQKAENTRLLMGADRVIVTQLHNSSKWVTDKHLYKLSVFQELSVENPFGEIRQKLFDRQLKDVPISNLAPILVGASSNKSIDIVSVEELKKTDFMFYKFLKADKIKYLVVVKIQNKNIILGYMFLVFLDKQSPPKYDKKLFNDLINLGIQIGDVLA